MLSLFKSIIIIVIIKIAEIVILYLKIIEINGINLEFDGLNKIKH